MPQGYIAARVGVARKTVNRTLLRQTANASLGPGKSTDALRKTAARQEWTLVKMVHEDRFKSARALTERIRNLYGVLVCRKTINIRLVAKGYHARRLCLDWVRRWQDLTLAAWTHAILGDESHFQLYPVDCRMRIRRLPRERLQQDCQAAMVQAAGGSVHVWGAFHRGAKSPPVLLDRTSMAW